MSNSGLASLAQSSATNTTEINRVVVSSVIGTAVEWYDFLIYGAATALVFNKLFFPLSDPALSTIAAFGTYAVGFLARPLGAAIFGHFGDRVGRKAMLAMTIVIMGLGTFLIGLLPTYEQIGIAAPILLVLLRLLQGIGIGGEWGGAVLMVVENAPARSRGILGSMVQIGWPIGNLAAIGAFAALAQVPEPDFLAWAWRIPFLISIVLVGIGLYIRMQLEETPVFRELEAKNAVARLPLIEILTRHRRSFFTAVGLKLSEISYAIIGGVFAISYVTGNLAMPRNLIINAILLSAIVALLIIPVFGWLSDRIGRKTMFYASCLFAIGFAFPLFWLLDTKEPLTITLTIITAISFGQMVGFAVGAPWYSELFAARTRYSGASLGFQVGAAIGGLTPFAAATFMAWTGGATWPISLYLIVLAVITLIAAMAARNRRQSIELTWADALYFCAWPRTRSYDAELVGVAHPNLGARSTVRKIGSVGQGAPPPMPVMMHADPDQLARTAAIDFTRCAVAHWQTALGSELLGAYLIGSLAHGGFSRRYSDIDIALVTEAELPSHALDRMRCEAVALSAHWGPKLSLFWTDRHFCLGRFPPLDRIDYIDHAVTLMERECVRPMRPAIEEIQRYLAGAPFANWRDMAWHFATAASLEAKQRKV